MIAVIGGRVLDSTALAAFAVGRPVYMRALVWAAVEANIVLAVPSAALGRAWGLLEQEHHAALQVLLDLPNTVIGPPSNIAISPDGKLAIVANSIKIDPADKTKYVPESYAHIIDLTARPPKVIGRVKTDLEPSGTS